MKLSKKLLLLGSLFIVPAVMAKKTKKLQLMVVPGDSSYIFALNAGTGITYDPGAPRPQGSYYVTNAFIFPGGTVSKHQTDFSITKAGLPINLNNSLGMVYLRETLLQDVDFSGTLPASGTVIEMADWSFDFKKSCDGNNTLSATGLNTFETFPPQVGHAMISMISGVMGGSGCNQDRTENSFTAKIYLAQTGIVAALIKIKFDKEIEYKD